MWTVSVYPESVDLLIYYYADNRTGGRFWNCVEFTITGGEMVVGVPAVMATEEVCCLPQWAVLLSRTPCIVVGL